MGTQKHCCFEIFGFDILIDKHFNPLLVEVNCLPSLSSSSAVDKSIKTSLMGDTLTLVGIKYSDDEKVEPKITRMPEIFKNLNRN